MFGFGSLKNNSGRYWAQTSSDREIELNRLNDIVEGMHSDVSDQYNRVLAYSYRLPSGYNQKLKARLDAYTRNVSAFHKLKVLQTEPTIKKIRSMYCKLPGGVFRSNEKFMENIKRAKAVETANFLMVKKEGDKAYKAIHDELTKLKKGKKGR